MTDWQAAPPEIRLVGSVIYRCAECGGDIDGEPVFLPPLGSPDTRTYHPEHAPSEGLDHGR